MILQILADLRAVCHGVQPQRFQLGRWPHAGQQQQLGRVDGAAGEDHPPPAHDLPAGIGDAYGALAIEQHFFRQRAGDDFQIGAAAHVV